MSDGIEKVVLENLLESVGQLRDVMSSFQQELSEQNGRVVGHEGRIDTIEQVARELAETVHRGSGGREGLTTRFAMLEDSAKRMNSTLQILRRSIEKGGKELARANAEQTGEMTLARVEHVKGKWRAIGMFLSTGLPGVLALAIQLSHC